MSHEPQWSQYKTKKPWGLLGVRGTVKMKHFLVQKQTHVSLDEINRTPLGTRRLCSLFYLLCYAALLKILPTKLKLCSIFILQFLVNFHFMEKQ